MLAAVGSTAIIVTHDQEEAMSLGERVFVINQGRIVQYGTPDDIYARPRTRFVAEFMGRSNWFPGRMADDSKFQTDCGLSLEVQPRATNVTGTYEICVRPESID